MAAFIPTRAAQYKTGAAEEFKVVKYESYKAKPKQEKTSSGIISVGKKKEEDKRKGIDIQRARREIIKFGISGFTQQKQHEAKIALAVSLGAKGPKKEYKNYKDLVAQNKRQKRLDKKYEAMHLGKSSHSVGVGRQKMVFGKLGGGGGVGDKRKRKDDPLQIYGKPTLKIGDSKQTSKITKKNIKKKR